MAPANDIKMRLVAENQASAAINKVKQDVSGLDKAAGSAAGGLSALGKVAGVAGLAALGVKAAQAAAELAALGNQSLVMQGEFDALAAKAGQSGDEMLAAMRRASHGVVSDFELMLNANRAMVLGVADSGDEMAALLEFASRRARQLGTSLQSAFESLTLGIGRGSALILDNVGISLNDINDATEKYAKSLGKTAAQLSDNEKKAALLNAVMADNARAMADNASAADELGRGADRLGTAWTNFTTHIGESLGPALDARYGELADFVNRADALLNKSAETIADEQATLAGREASMRLGDAMNQIRILRGLADSGQVSFGRGELVAAGLNFDALSPELQDATAGMNEFYAIQLRIAADMQNSFVTSLQLASTNLGALTDSITPTVAMIQATNQAVRDSLQPVSQFAQSMQTASEVVNAAKFDKLFDSLLNVQAYGSAKESLGQIQSVLVEITGEWVRAGVPISDISDTLLPKLLGEVTDLTDEVLTGATTAEEAGQRINSGFLAGVPGVEVLLGRILALNGAIADAGAGLQAAQGFNLNTWQWRELQATGVRPAGLIGPAPRGVETPRPGFTPIDNTRGGWWGAAAETFGGKTAADLQSARIQALAQNQRNIAAGLSGGGGGGGMGAIDSQLNSIASRVKSVLTGALKSGINLDDILPRQDAVEEPARRLADIAVRGFESPWTQYIKDTFPEIWKEIETAGDPKAAAASILRDFEAGLRPELLDREKAKELVKRALLGDANVSQMASEIAAELSQELGVSLEQAQQAAAGVLGTGTGDTSALGMDGAGVAQAATDSFVGAIGGMLIRYQTSGQAAGTSWQAGFLGVIQSGLPSGVLQTLTSQLLPGLIAAMASQGSRAGAS